MMLFGKEVRIGDREKLSVGKRGENHSLRMKMFLRLQILGEREEKVTKRLNRSNESDQRPGFTRCRHPTLFYLFLSSLSIFVFLFFPFSPLSLQFSWFDREVLAKWFYDTISGIRSRILILFYSSLHLSPSVCLSVSSVRDVLFFCLFHDHAFFYDDIKKSVKKQ